MPAYWALIDLDVYETYSRPKLEYLSYNGVTLKDNLSRPLQSNELYQYIDFKIALVNAASDISQGPDSPIFNAYGVTEVRLVPIQDLWSSGAAISASRKVDGKNAYLYFGYTAKIVDIFLDGSRSDPSVLAGPTEILFNPTDHTPGNGTTGGNASLLARWSDWIWVEITLDAELPSADALFSNKNDNVNFTNLAQAQIDSIANNNNDIYSALIGDDIVVLPGTPDYQLTPAITWDPTQVFSGGAGSDKITGGDGADRIDGGADDDTIFGSEGADVLSGGLGQDNFDFGDLNIASLQAGTVQTLDGGTHPTGGPAYLPTSPDTLFLPGKATDYKIWNSGNITTIVSSAAGSSKFTLNLTETEKVRFSESFENAVSQNNLYAEMIRLAVDAYSPGPTTRNWHSLSAIELGMRPDYAVSSLTYTMRDGHYSATFQNTVLGSTANANISVGIVSGVKTLSIAFRGTDQLGDVEDWGGFKAHYDKFQPLIEALDKYVEENSIAQVLVSGHSLGGAMVQEFMAQAQHSGSKYRALTIGSPGGNTPIPGDDNRIINLSHTGDPVAIISSISDRDGSNVFINSDVDGFLDPIDEHDKNLYLTNYLKLLGFARDASSGFSRSDVASALKDGLRYDGSDVQIAVGKASSDIVNTTAGDDYVLAAGGNETIVWNDIVTTRMRVIDGGAGTEDQINLPGTRSEWAWERDGSAYNLMREGRDVGQLWGVEKLVFTSFGFETEVTLPGQAKVSQFEALAVTAEPIVAWLDGRAAAVQRPAGSATTVTVDTGFDYLDVGAGNLTVVGSSSSDIIVLGTGNQTVTGGGGSDIVDGGAAGLGSVLRITGGQGDDLIAGSKLADTTAKFSSQASDYAITVRPDGMVFVSDLRDGSPDGTDQLWLVDKLEFSDKTILTSDIGLEPTVESRLIAVSGLTASFGGDGAIFGSQGYQDIMVYDVAGNITFDPSFNRGGDIIRLEDAAIAYTIMVSGSTALISHGYSNIEIPIGPVGVLVMFTDGGRKLYYDASQGTVKIGTQAVGASPSPITANPDGTPLPGGSDALAYGTLLLGPGADVVIAGNLSVYGTAEDERISLLYGGEIRFDPSFNRGGDYILMNAYASQFQAHIEASSVVFEISGGTLIVPIGPNGTTFDFHGEDNRELVYDQALRAVTLGNQVIGTDNVILTDIAVIV